MPTHSEDILDGKSILLIIGGGIAAYKCLDLIRRLKEKNARVRIILTKSGAEFVTPLSLSGLSGEKVYQELFSLTDETEMGHIRLSRESDLILVAPATANMMAKMAAGMADNLATTTLLATDKPVMIAPSMNMMMWQHKATRRNLKILMDDGIEVIHPRKGALACGEEGDGRLAEVEDMLAAMEKFFTGQQQTGSLSGKHILITAGPTHEAIDPVRYIANHSSGKQGYALARTLRDKGARITLVSGPVALDVPAGVDHIRVTTAQEMYESCLKALPADIAICVAAVADWRVENSATQKIKKQKNKPDHNPLSALTLQENPDILKSLSSAGEDRPALVIGFAAETENLEQHALDKLKSKNCDWIVANNVSDLDGPSVMGGDDNQIALISDENISRWPAMAKAEVARRLSDQIEEYFNQKTDQQA